MQGRAEATQSGPATSRGHAEKSWGLEAGRRGVAEREQVVGRSGDTLTLLCQSSLCFLLDPQRKPPTLSQSARELPKAMGTTCPDWTTDCCCVNTEAFLEMTLT